MQNLPKSKKYGSAIEHILGFMPALSAYVETLVLSGLDTNRKDSSNDFFDRELFVYGLSYSEIFSAVDKWICSLASLTKRHKYPSVFQFVGNLDDLDRALEEIN